MYKYKMEGLAKTICFSGVLGGGESLTVFDEEGPILINSLNVSLPPYGPSVTEAQQIAVYVEDNDTPIVNVPLLNFAGLTHGRISKMVTRYADSSGSTVTLRWPMSAQYRMRIVVTNGSGDPVPLAVFVSYQNIWSGRYLSAIMAHREPEIGKPVSVKLPNAAVSLLGIVVAVNPSDSEWCGEGKVYLGKEVIADGLDMLGGAYLDTSQCFGLDRGISVSVKADPTVRGHEFLGIYQWFLEGLAVDKGVSLTIEQVGRHVMIDKGHIVSHRVPRKDVWNILLVTEHHIVPDTSGYDFSLSEIDSHLWYRDYEESSFRERLWSSMQRHMQLGSRG